MLFKWGLISIASGICVFYGYLASGRLKKREQSINSFIIFFSALKNEMAYSKRDIEDALKRLMNISNKNMKVFIKCVLDELSVPNASIKNAFKVSIARCEDSGGLFFEHEDVLIILNAAVMLGTTDYEGQEQVIDATIEQLKVKMYSAKDACTQKGHLYKKLGIFACAAIIIIFI